MATAIYRCAQICSDVGGLIGTHSNESDLTDFEIWDKLGFPYVSSWYDSVTLSGTIQDYIKASGTTGALNTYTVNVSAHSYYSLSSCRKATYTTIDTAKDKYSFSIGGSGFSVYKWAYFTRSCSTTIGVTTSYTEIKTLSPSTLTKFPYSFDAYVSSTSLSNTSVVYSEPYICIAPIVYKPTNVVTLEKNGGTGGSDTLTITIDSSGNVSCSSITIPSRTGYIFGGYADIGGGTRISSAGVVSTDKTSLITMFEYGTLYAQWSVGTMTYYTVYDNLFHIATYSTRTNSACLSTNMSNTDGAFLCTVSTDTSSKVLLANKKTSGEVYSGYNLSSPTSNDYVFPASAGKEYTVSCLVSPGDQLSSYGVQSIVGRIMIFFFDSAYSCISTSSDYVDHYITVGYGDVGKYKLFKFNFTPKTGTRYCSIRFGHQTGTGGFVDHTDINYYGITVVEASSWHYTHGPIGLSSDARTEDTSAGIGNVIVDTTNYFPGIKSSTVTTGTTSTFSGLLDAPSYSNMTPWYVFKGWRADTPPLVTSQPGSLTYVTGNTVVTGNAKLFSVWEPVTLTYTINKNDGNISVDSVSFSYSGSGDVITGTVSCTASRTGYTFLGFWQQFYVSYGNGSFGYYGGKRCIIDATGYTYSIDKDLFSAMYYSYYHEGVTTLDAKWEELTYYVNFSAGTTASTTAGYVYSLTKYYTQSLSLYDTAKYFKKTYTQKGWSVNEDGSTNDYPFTGSLKYTTNASCYLYPYFERDTVTFTVCPGSYSSGSNQSTSGITVGSDVSLGSYTTYSRTGYTQTGWSSSTDGGTKSFELSGTYSNIQSDVSLYPYWTPDTYTITYGPGDYGSGTTPSAGIATHDASYTVLGITYTRTGYQQTGWTDGTNTYDLSTGYKFTANVTLTPVWTEAYTLTYNGGDDLAESVTPVTITYLTGTSVLIGGLSVFSTTASKVGYTFAGTWKDSDNASYTAGGSIVITSDISLTPVWTINKYVVTYRDSEASTNKTEMPEENYNTVVTLEDAYDDKTGWRQTAWSDGTNTYSPGSSYTITHDVDFYAVWTKLYYITYKPDAYTENTVNEVKESKLTGATYHISAAKFTRTGYTQSKWRKETDSTVEYSFGESYSSDAHLALLPTWTPHVYTLTYTPNDANESTSYTQSKTHGVQVHLRALTYTKGCHTQTGWYDSIGNEYDLSDSFDGNANKTFKPSWTINTFTITYSAGTTGATGETTTVTYNCGQTPNLKSAYFTKTGYKQTGWACGSTTYPIGGVYSGGSDITFTPVFSESYVTITYDCTDSFLDDAGHGLKYSVVQKDTDTTLESAVVSSLYCTQTGWSKNRVGTDGYSKQYDVSSTVSLQDDITLYPYVEYNTFTITYTKDDSSSGDNVVDTGNRKDGVQIRPTGMFLHSSGYEQTGWTVTKGSGVVDYKFGDLFTTQTTSSSLTLYPVWDTSTGSPGTFTITYTPGKYGLNPYGTAAGETYVETPQPTVFTSSNPYGTRAGKPCVGTVYYGNYKDLRNSGLTYRNYTRPGYVNVGYALYEGGPLVYRFNEQYPGQGYIYTGFVYDSADDVYKALPRYPLTLYPVWQEDGNEINSESVVSPRRKSLSHRSTKIIQTNS